MWRPLTHLYSVLYGVYVYMQRLIQFLLPYFSIDASKETGRLGRLVNHGKKNERNASMKEFKGQLVLFAIRYISINILMVFNFCKACLHHFLFYGFILLHVISFTFKFSLSEKLKKHYLLYSNFTYCTIVIRSIGLVVTWKVWVHF